MAGENRDASVLPTSGERRRGRLEKHAKWLEREHPSSAGLWKGLAKIFTVNCLGLSPSPSRCLVSINVMENRTVGCDCARVASAVGGTAMMVLR